MSDFDRWEARFASDDYVFGTEPNAFLRSHARLLRPGQTALAVADGEGRNGVWLARQGLDVTAVEFSPRAIAKARALAEQAGVSYRAEQADVAQWAWPHAAFDVVAAIFIQFATPALRVAIFQGIKQALKPGGVLLLQGYRPDQLQYRTGGPSQIEHLYTRSMLEAAFADLTSFEIHEHDSVLREGAGHNGMSALIDLVGRK